MNLEDYKETGELGIKEHRYKCALSESGTPIFIGDITKENKKETSYTCMGCDKRLFPVLGEKRVHHFRHEEGAECSDYNRYLHEYAKAELKRRFDEGETFIIEYNAHFQCVKFESCQVRLNHKWMLCSYDWTHKEDLKKKYDTCTPEKGFYEELEEGKRRYVADLKLTSSTDGKLPPTILEVWVNHECTEQKRSSGARIIEIKIEKEEDACREIRETADGDEKPILFYGFNRDIKTNPRYFFQHLKVMPGIYSKVVVMTKSSCDEKVEFDKDINCSYEIILSNTSRGYLYPKMYEIALACYLPLLQVRELCSNYYTIVKNGKKFSGCHIGTKCPCKNYKLDSNKKDEYLKFFSENDVEIWTSDLQNKK